MQSGLVKVKQGKGKKDRSAAIGATTRRGLLGYRRLSLFRDNSGTDDLTVPVFQTDEATRFTGNGLMMVFPRLSKRTGNHVTAHALRRTFVILSLRAGMNPLHLQILGGWADLEIVQH